MYLIYKDKKVKNRKNQKGSNQTFSSVCHHQGWWWQTAENARPKPSQSLQSLTFHPCIQDTFHACYFHIFSKLALFSWFLLVLSYFWWFSVSFDKNQEIHDSGSKICHEVISIWYDICLYVLLPCTFYIIFASILLNLCRRQSSPQVVYTEKAQSGYG